MPAPASASRGLRDLPATVAEPSLLASASPADGAIGADKPIVSLPTPDQIAEAVRGAKKEETEQKPADANKAAAANKRNSSNKAAAANKQQPALNKPLSTPPFRGNLNNDNMNMSPLSPQEQRRVQAYNAAAERALNGVAEARARMQQAMLEMQGGIMARARQQAEDVFGPQGPFSGPFWGEESAADDDEDDVAEAAEDLSELFGADEEAEDEDESGLFGGNDEDDDAPAEASNDDDGGARPPSRSGVIRVSVGPSGISGSGVFGGSSAAAGPYPSYPSAGGAPFPSRRGGVVGGLLDGLFGPAPVGYGYPQSSMGPYMGGGNSMPMQQSQMQQHLSTVRPPRVTREQMKELDAGVAEAGKALDAATRAFSDAMAKRVQAGVSVFFEGFAPSTVEETEEDKSTILEPTTTSKPVAAEAAADADAAAPATPAAAAEQAAAAEAPKEEPVKKAEETIAAPAKEEEKKEEKAAVAVEEAAPAAPVQEQPKKDEPVAAAAAVPETAAAAAATPASAEAAPKEKEETKA